MSVGLHNLQVLEHGKHHDHKIWIKTTKKIYIWKIKWHKSHKKGNNETTKYSDWWLWAQKKKQKNKSQTQSNYPKTIQSQRRKDVVQRSVTKELKTSFCVVSRDLDDHLSPRSHLKELHAVFIMVLLRVSCLVSWNCHRVYSVLLTFPLYIKIFVSKLIKSWPTYHAPFHCLNIRFWCQLTETIFYAISEIVDQKKKNVLF